MSFNEQSVERVKTSLLEIMLKKTFKIKVRTIISPETKISVKHSLIRLSKTIPYLQVLPTGFKLFQLALFFTL
jgi:hypothetical protein